MKIIFRYWSCVICFASILIFLFSQSQAQGNGNSSVVYIPDGQLMSNPVRVYVSDVHLTEGSKPRLLAYSTNSIKNSVAEFKHLDVIKDTNFVMDGVQRNGSLILFNFGENDIYEKLCGGWWASLVTSARFFPVLKWEVKKTEHEAAGDDGQFVIIGNLVRSSITMAVLLIAITVVILNISKKRTGSRFSLAMGEDGSASISKVQLIAWTIAAAFCVGVFGLAHRVLPDIPASLIVLLGLSIVTTGSAYALGTSQGSASALPAVSDAGPELGVEEDTPNDDEAVPLENAEAVAPVQSASLTEQHGRFGFFTDLISDNASTSSKPILSVAKAQMLIWTVVSLVLFLSKSLFNGDLWVIPWELVVLMGFSQTSYLVPKYWKLSSMKT